MKYSNSQYIGKLGEDIASRYLLNRGFDVLCRNYRKKYGEIDIIGIDSSSNQHEKVLAFIEVKTRKSNSFGSPLEAITPWKLKSLIKAAQFYKLIHPNLPDSMRVDAVAVTLGINNKVGNIELIKNISGF